MLPCPEPDAPCAAAARHAAMVAQLRRPGACGGHPDAAGCIETHISTLLLAGGQVFKLKKPVQLPFVDFSTLALREHACQQELRLNRRTAPHWYLDVVPVRQGDGGALIDPPGRPSAGAVLDWAVRMRRFDDQQLFDRLAIAGRLLPRQVDALAEAVARLQAGQGPSPPGHGGADAVRQVARENLAELAALQGEGAASAGIAALLRWTEAQGAALAPLMEQRRRAGQVREGHGDLHLANIVWADGQAVLFDALEFDDNLRHIDTVGDLAFAFMDLLAHGLPREAWRFVNAALEATGDWAALPLLRWWAVHRAAVRAKVALLSAPAGGGDEGRAAARARCARYLAVAQALMQPPPPALVLMMGLSGSGKTVVAGLLAQRLGGVRLRSDVERKRQLGLSPTARATPASGLYTAEATRRTYERLLALAEAALQAGVPVVVDAASLRRAERDAMRALAGRLGRPFHLLLCEAGAALLQQRLAQRQAAGHDPSDATAEVLANQQQFTEWPAADEGPGLLRLHNDGDLAGLAAQVEALTL